MASAPDSYEAMVLSANLPNHCIAFIYRDGEPKLAGGVYRIERVRTATSADLAAFNTPAADNRCPLCNELVSV